jgi:alkylhydroperoxidase/carboxymuconolactone decarboxylase family protein YurZ
MEKNPLLIFQKEAPDVADAYNQLIMSLIKTQGLEPKTKQLIYIAMKIVTSDFVAIKYHVPMAKKAGASRDEVLDTVLLSLTVCGLKGISHCLEDVLNIYDQTEN